MLDRVACKLRALHDFRLDQCFVPPVLETRELSNRVRDLLIPFWLREHFDVKRPRGGVVDQESQVRRILIDIHDIELIEHRRHLLCDQLGIINTNTKAHDRAHVSKNRIPHLRVALLGGELRNVLMRKDQIKTILARLRKNRRDTVGDEVLKLVDIQIEVVAVFLGNVHPRECGHLQLRHDNQSQEIRVHLPDLAL